MALGLGLGAACGGGGGDDGGDEAGSAGDGASKPVRGITITAKEYAFEPADPALPESSAPAESEIELKNTGSLEHDLVIDEPKFKVTALPGQTKSAKVDLEPGIYTIYCSVAGHEAAGMKGKLTVP